MSDGDLDRCDVKDCGRLAIALVRPTHGQTDHEALRCRECLLYDLERGWFEDWQAAIEERDDPAIDVADLLDASPGTTLILDEAQDVGPERRWNGSEHPPHPGGGESPDTQPESDPDECWTFSCEDEPDGTLYSKTRNVEICETHGRRLSNDPTWGDYVPYEEQDASIQWGGE